MLNLIPLNDLVFAQTFDSIDLPRFLMLTKHDFSKSTAPEYFDNLKIIYRNQCLVSRLRIDDLCLHLLTLSLSKSFRIHHLGIFLGDSGYPFCCIFFRC